MKCHRLDDAWIISVANLNRGANSSFPKQKVCKAWGKSDHNSKIFGNWKNITVLVLGLRSSFLKFLDFKILFVFKYFLFDSYFPYCLHFLLISLLFFSLSFSYCLYSLSSLVPPVFLPVFSLCVFSPLCCLSALD